MHKTLPVLVFVSFLIGCGSGGSNDTNTQRESVISTPQTQAKPALPVLSVENKLEEIAVFIELANQVRFFHPSDGVMFTPWDKFISYGIYKVANTHTHEEFVSVLQTLFVDIAPNLIINGKSFIPLESPQDTDEAIAWQNNGYKDTYYNGPSVYARTRQTNRYNHLPHFDTTSAEYHQTLPLSIEFTLPIVLKIVDSQTQPLSSAPTGEFENYDVNISFENLYARLAAVGQLWAVIQHFYPYLDEIAVNWSNELPVILNSCLESTQACGLAMRKMLTKTEDNHNSIRSKYTTLGVYTPAVGFDWLDEKALVVHKDSALEVAIGDELIAINDVDLLSVIEEKKHYALRAENRMFKYLVNYDLLRGQENQEIKLTLKDQAGSEYQLNTQKTHAAYDVYVKTISTITSGNENKVRKLENDIYYVNFDEFEEADIAPALEQLKNAKAVIFDFRNYPIWQGWRGMLGHFIEFNIPAPPLFNKVYLSPNQSAVTTTPVKQILTARKPFLDIPAIALS